MEVLNKGTVPGTSEAEYIENGERLPGGTADSRGRPTLNGVTQRQHAKPCAAKTIEQWWRRRDRCAAQFQGAKAFKGVQDFERKTGVTMRDCSPPAQEGKWLCDGYGNRPARVAEQNAIRPEDETWKPGVRDFCYFTSSKMLRPSNADNFGQGRWGPTEYFHATYPDCAFEENPPPVKTWPGSDNSHYFHGKHDKENTNIEDELIRRHKLCSCDPCIEGLYHNCKSNALDKGLWYGYKEVKRMVCEAVKEVALTRAARTFEELQSWTIFQKPQSVLQKNNVIAVRVHAKDRSLTGEAYYLAKVTSKVRQLKEGGKFEGNWYDKGFYVFGATWYHYKGTALAEKGKVGDRHYCLGTAPTDKCTLQLNGVVTGINSFSFKSTSTKKGRDKIFVLSDSDHDTIMMKGTLSV